MRITPEQARKIGLAQDAKGNWRDTPWTAAGVNVASLDIIAPAKKRIRQSSKPLMNKLEQDWFNYLSRTLPADIRLRAQAKKYRLANGSWYKPDMTATTLDLGPALWRETAWECKGPKQMKGISRGMLTLKFAASAWPEVRFVLVYKDESGNWKQENVLP